MRILYSIILLSFLAFYALAQPQPKGVKIEGGSAPLGTERRVAILVANQDYADNRMDLKKTYNDADDMKQTLELLGFEVIDLGKDLSRVKLDRLLSGLEAKVRGYNVGFFYYSGHGSEFEGKNYLLPTDIPELEYRSDIATYGIPLDRVYSALRNGGIKTSFVVIDACRSLPMGKSQGLPTGMVLPASNPTGTFTMFATRSGNVAQENSQGRNGYFTQELCKNLIMPNWGISKIFYETRKGVKAVTSNQQDPSSSNELDDDFVFVQTTTSPSRSSAIVASEPVKTAPAPERRAEPVVTKVEPKSVANLAQTKIAQEKQAYKDKDYTTAFRLLSAHADLLDAEGQTDLGSMYANGTGVKKNAVQAVSWFRKAAEQGDAAGQTSLGLMYLEGTGVERNTVQAVSWYRKAAEQGDVNGQASLGFMYEQGTGVERDAVQAVSWYRKAAEQGDVNGQASLGFMYEQGTGVEKDMATAINYFQLAARQGHSLAQAYLKNLNQTW